MNFIILLFNFLIVGADIYLHNPRGSNNRLNENSRERTNANRLFDSQNNERGGYNVGSLYYYEGSVLKVEWTNQHSCHSPNNNCEIIIQYMCHDMLRDGTTTDIIPENNEACNNLKCNTDKQYGMHETYDSYVNCKNRQRNSGLFTADQKLVQRNARSTRQNPDGVRNGYECPEEKDYYPYWHPTEWKDIVILTNNISRCSYYETESQNVKSRWICVLPKDIVLDPPPKNFMIPITKEDCESLIVDKNNGTYAVWTEISSHGLPPPECLETQFNQDNHLGNTIGGYSNSFNWTIPIFSQIFPNNNVYHDQCVLRVRYNISTGEYNGWSHEINSSLNKSPNGEGSLLPLGPKFNFQNATAWKRGYIFKNAPDLKIFPDIDLVLQIAVNTAQYGRVFQDRSHVFSIKKRPPELSNGVIYNVNVRGKRGNIVQVYPGVEYDFVPDDLIISKEDYIHFQWTGSNSNPPKNDGEGQEGTDRSNIILQAGENFPDECNCSYGPGKKYGHWGRNFPEHLSNISFLGFSKEDILLLAFLNNHLQGNVAELNDAGTYFDLGLRKITNNANGTYYYMCIRNNNFSNRSQKGKISVYDYLIRSKTIGKNGGNISIESDNFISTGIFVDKGVFKEQYQIRLENWPKSVGEEKMKNLKSKLPSSTNVASDFLLIHPEHTLTNERKTFRVELGINKDEKNVKVYRTDSNFATWQTLDPVIDGNIAVVFAISGGVYVAGGSPSLDIVVAMVIMVLALLILIFATIYYFRRRPDNWEKIQHCFGKKILKP